MMIQVEQEVFFGDLRVHFIDPDREFLARNVWLYRFEACAIFCYMKLSREAESAGIKVAESCP